MDKLDFNGMNQDSKHHDPLYEKDREVWKQIVNALNFFLSEEGEENIILQCGSRDDIPHVRRTVINLLGHPNRFGATRLEYPNGTIHIVSVNNDRDMFGLRGLPFYLSRGDRFDLSSLSVHREPFPYSMLHIWEDIGLSGGEMIREVIKSGYPAFWAFTLIETYLHDKGCL